ncbi:MAG: hypothetical protein AABY07_04160, partial [Nanoarchaeota archaeon]
MKKGVILLFLVLTLFILISSTSFVSAGLLNDVGKWFKNFFGGGITGKTSHLACTDSDIGITEQRLRHYVKGYVETPNGTFWDYCSGLVNYDYHCSIGSDTVNAFTTTITCPYQCTDGACIDQESCTDTDGINYNYKAEVKWSFTNGSSQVFTDYCDSSTRLSEQTCTGSTPTQEYYNCPSGCSNGACSNGGSGGTACGPNNVSACSTSANCTTAGGNWCDGVCQSTACSSASGNYSTCSDTDGLYYFE